MSHMPHSEMLWRGALAWLLLNLIVGAWLSALHEGDVDWRGSVRTILTANFILGGFLALLWLLLPLADAVGRL